MKFSLLTSLFLSTLVAPVAFAAVRGSSSSNNVVQEDMKTKQRHLGMGMGMMGNSDEEDAMLMNVQEDSTRTLTLTIINQSFDQPLGPFFVMVHNSDAIPLYIRGQMASDELAVLAEDGSPADLVTFYTDNNEGVKSATGFNMNAPYLGGSTFQMNVEVSDEFPLVTIASMAINTNDCFVSINGSPLQAGQVIDLPGLDAGSEENNELCESIPGPGCALVNTTNVRSLNGEGFVHVHRGFFGIGDLLPQQQYDWRNPMVRVVVREAILV